MDETGSEFSACPSEINERGNENRPKDGRKREGKKGFRAIKGRKEKGGFTANLRC